MEKRCKWFYIFRVLWKELLDRWVKSICHGQIRNRCLEVLKWRSSTNVNRLLAVWPTGCTKYTKLRGNDGVHKLQMARQVL